jgi:hypothetical protein
MNVLGVLFYTKLKQSLQISKIIEKAKCALHSKRLIKGYFNPLEIKQYLNSNFYSDITTPKSGAFQN